MVERVGSDNGQGMAEWCLFLLKPTSSWSSASKREARLPFAVRRMRSQCLVRVNRMSLIGHKQAIIGHGTPSRTFICWLSLRLRIRRLDTAGVCLLKRVKTSAWGKHHRVQGPKTPHTRLQSEAGLDPPFQYISRRTLAGRRR